MKYDFQFLKDLENKNTPESHHLDFSLGIADLRRKDKFLDSVCKEISGFANADSGEIVVGVKAKKIGKMEVIDKIGQGIDPEVFGKEDLEQMLLGNISPKIDLRIQVIKKSTRNKNWYAVINVPKADTAVQSLRDCKYYRRRNFMTVPMTNDEVVDVMNRKKNPILRLQFFKTNKLGDNCLDVLLINKGKVVADDFGFNLSFKTEEASAKWYAGNDNLFIQHKDGKTHFKYRNYLDHNKPKLFPGDDYLVTTEGQCEIRLLVPEIELEYEIFSPESIFRKRKKIFA